MKNRFKFRAWYYDKDDENDSDNNKMFYNAQDTYDCLGGNPPLRASSFGDIIDDERWVVEQCTGLKDKNGKLIYEGDIVEVSEAYENGIYEIKFCQSDCEYNLYNSEGNFIYQLTKSMARYMEVIGNIHENTNLLENEE
mgnify:CR=1 FL=1